MGEVRVSAKLVAQLITLRNVTKRWESHAKNCSGLKSTPAPLSAQAQAFVVQCTIGGENLNKLCDAYVVAYWLCVSTSCLLTWAPYYTRYFS
jgi:hypothetical protein